MPEVIVDALVHSGNENKSLPPKYPPAAQLLSLHALPDEPDPGRVDNSGTDPQKDTGTGWRCMPRALGFSATSLNAPFTVTL